VEHRLIQRSQEVPLRFRPAECARKSKRAILNARERGKIVVHLLDRHVSPTCSPLNKTSSKKLVERRRNKILSEKELSPASQCLVHLSHCPGLPSSTFLTVGAT